MTTWTTDDILDQTGKRVIVTGATGGLGLETALVLADKGAEVILAARNPQKGAEAERLIRARFPNAQVRFDALDSFAAELAGSGSEVIVLEPAELRRLVRRQLAGVAS